MAKLPIVSGTEAVKALQRLGFFIDRQRGSHAVLKKVTSEGERGCVIPMHREVALGTLRSALKMAGVSPEEFKDALRLCLDAPKKDFKQKTKRAPVFPVQSVCLSILPITPHDLSGKMTPDWHPRRNCRKLPQ